MEKLTLEPHERLLIERLRLGLSQEQVAKEWSKWLADEENILTPYIYGEWERGNIIPYDGIINACPIKYNSKLTKLEQCIILRKRSGITQENLAIKLRCSRYWLNMMETGKEDPARLMGHWGIK